MSALTDAFDSIADRRVILVGGKGGVGKTTIARAAAAHFPRSVLFSSDPASLNAEELYSRFLAVNLDSFLEAADRGTYFDREELRRFFELSLPGIDELMAWMRIGELAEEDPSRIVVVDTAPTGHTVRMLSAGDHFRQFAEALDAMQEKHRDMVRQFTRRSVRDALDAFIEDFDAKARSRRELLLSAGAFIPVLLSEPWVVVQTERLIAEVEIAVPFVVLNRAATPDCERDRVRAQRDAEARARFPRVVDNPRWCIAPDAQCRTSSPACPAAARRPSAADKLESLSYTTLTFLAGKGGVGKTTCAASIALQLANTHPNNQYVALSVDPAHTLRDVFADEQPPPNLKIETIDTRAKWRAFRDTLGADIERAINALTPQGVSIAYETDAMRSLVEIAPPGADEIFAITRLADLLRDDSLAGIIVDTAPTGHFLRLLELPRTAGEWVREFMRLLLRYKELVPPGVLGEELVQASRSLKEVDETLRSDRASVIVVTRPEREVVAESKRLLDDLRHRGMHVGGVIANYVTPDTDCPCDQSMRAYENAALAELGDVVTIERRDAPPVTLSEIATLVPLP